MKVIGPVLALIFLACVISVPIAIYQDVMAEKFDLVKADWSCSAHHDESSTIYITVDKVMMPITNTVPVCDQWSRKN